ncbi:hypothetical protein L596_026819 [Steinernema carpocapsae]|uniref:G-protein coupled receptors family 1 profile domain-containing protein n=1 Tax=Steinernema carpocapsae TaxID=34508 RepID=A0A4U5M2G6_STECR|nr:hypothetical protein L596_026819 [Steinernema carpocapsae]
MSVIVIYSKLKKALNLQGTNSSNATKKIFKSLFLIIVFYLSGWVLTITVSLAVQVFIQDPNLAQVVEVVVGLTAGSNLCVPFFIFYMQSSLYKNEIKKLFGLNKIVAADSNVFMMK